MAKVKYCARENTRMGRHSFYAVPMPYSTITFEELCAEACKNTSIEQPIMMTAATLFFDAVVSNLIQGHRVQVGKDFLTLYPNLVLSVKDTVDDNGNVLEAATAKMLNASNGKSRIAATVHPKFSEQFARNVSWQKVDEKSGAVVEEDIVEPNPNEPGGGGAVTPPEGGDGF